VEDKIGPHIISKFVNEGDRRDEPLSQVRKEWPRRDSVGDDHRRPHIVRNELGDCFRFVGVFENIRTHPHFDAVVLKLFQLRASASKDCCHLVGSAEILCHRQSCRSCPVAGIRTDDDEPGGVGPPLRRSRDNILGGKYSAAFLLAVAQIVTLCIGRRVTKIWVEYPIYIVSEHTLSGFMPVNGVHNPLSL
jgi:hypothetical protein